MTYFKAMSIKPTGIANQWHITASISLHGRIYKAERKRFTGAHSRAVSEWGRLKVELRAAAEKKEKFRMKGPRCPQCRHYVECEGPWKEYPQIFGWDEFKPMDR